MTSGVHALCHRRVAFHPPTKFRYANSFHRFRESRRKLRSNLVSHHHNNVSSSVGDRCTSTCFNVTIPSLRIAAGLMIKRRRISILLQAQRCIWCLPLEEVDDVYEVVVRLPVNDTIPYPIAIEPLWYIHSRDISVLVPRSSQACRNTLTRLKSLNG